MGSAAHPEVPASGTGCEGHLVAVNKLNYV
jgi:hypothetical protein